MNLPCLRSFLKMYLHFKTLSFSAIEVRTHTADEICALLGCYAASSGNPLPTFRNNLSVPSSRDKRAENSSWTS
jgi:hypothetical protein